MNQMIYDMELLTDGISAKEYDYFILAPNVEERSRAIFSRFRETIRCNTYILINYSYFHKTLDESQEQSFFDDFKGVNTLVANGDDDSGILSYLNSIKIASSSRVAIDITGLSIPSVFSVMHYLKSVCLLNTIDVFYSEPQYYIYEEGYFDSYHKYPRHRVCAPITGYMNSGRNQKEILIIFLGFDGGLADFVFGELAEEGIEIVRTIVVNGFPSYTSKLKDVSLFNNESLISKLDDKSNVMVASAYNPYDTYNLLLKIKAESEGILLNICTIGSKPMALGACLFALNYKEAVKATYPFYSKTHFDLEEHPGKMWRYGVLLN